MERRSHDDQVRLRLPLPLLRDPFVVFPQARAASVSGKPRAPSRGSTSLALSVCVCVCVRVASGRPFPSFSRVLLFTARA